MNLPLHDQDEVETLLMLARLHQIQAARSAQRARDDLALYQRTGAPEIRRWTIIEQDDSRLHFELAGLMRDEAGHVAASFRDALASSLGPHELAELRHACEGGSHGCDRLVAAGLAIDLPLERGGYTVATDLGREIVRVMRLAQPTPSKRTAK